MWVLETESGASPEIPEGSRIPQVRILYKQSISQIFMEKWRLSH